MNLYRATKTNLLTQPFGVNIPCVKLDTSGQPIRPFIVQTFPISDGKGGVIWNTPVGWTKFYPAIGLLGHNGVDWMTWRGEPVYFNATDKDGNKIEGRCKTEIDADGGKGVDVFFEDEGSHWKLRYWHLKDQSVYDGQVIKSGDLIGYADSTGASNGDHLHEGLKHCDQFGNTLATDNGYSGAIDPATCLDVNYYPKDFIIILLNLKQQLTILQQVVKLYHQLLKRS